jgi:hypothetical protein
VPFSLWEKCGGAPEGPDLWVIWAGCQAVGRLGDGLFFASFEAGPDLAEQAEEILSAELGH